MKELTEWDIAQIVDGIPETNLALFCPGLHGRGASLLDRSQYANHGTISGATWVRLPSGLLVLSYNGTSNYTIFVNSASLQITAAITAEAWVKQLSLPDASDYEHIIGKYGNHTAWSTGMCNNAGTLVLAGATRTSPLGNIGTIALSLNTWYHTAMTNDGTTTRLYVNGVPDTTLAEAGVLDAVEAVFEGRCTDDERWLNGLIGLRRIYNRALTATEILRHYTREKPWLR